MRKTLELAGTQAELGEADAGAITRPASWPGSISARSRRKRPNGAKLTIYNDEPVDISYY